MIDENRLIILTNGAKYDVSCSSSGSSRQNTPRGIGNASYAGICHSFTQDGRCVSLLKILMSNDCVYDCKYCVNRRSNDLPRATASPDELCELVIAFYKRNYIEGLFLSSAIIKTPDHTMELLYETVKKLRLVYRFNGYIHVKGIPNADKLLIERTGLIADRMSFNIELPSETSLNLLAPQKSKDSILKPMKMLALDKYYDSPFKRRKDFLPAGQTTQLRNLGFFPVEINTAPLETLLRVPGIGMKSAAKIIMARKHSIITYEDLKRMKVVLKRAAHFITCNGKYIGTRDEKTIKDLLVSAENTINAEQLSMFGTNNAALSALYGEL